MSPCPVPPPSQCVIIGAGPCGLRAAVELGFLGARVVLLEKRDAFSRNNVLHLWPFTIHDLRGLGAKKFHGKFCAGSIDHISECRTRSTTPLLSLVTGWLWENFTELSRRFCLSCRLTQRKELALSLFISLSHLFSLSRYSPAAAGTVEGGSAPGGGGTCQRGVQGAAGAT